MQVFKISKFDWKLNFELLKSHLNTRTIKTRLNIFRKNNFQEFFFSVFPNIWKYWKFQIFVLKL
jgi:hypothetical protein